MSRVSSLALRTALVVVGLFAGTFPAAAACGAILNPMLVTATPVSFGFYNPGAAGDHTANGSVTLDCVLNDEVPSFDATLTAGFSNPDFTPRKMHLLTNTLNYNIFKDSGLSEIWGNGSDSSEVNSYTETANVGLVTLTAFGAIPTGQFVPPGLYIDALTVQITF